MPGCARRSDRPRRNSIRRVDIATSFARSGRRRLATPPPRPLSWAHHIEPMQRRDIERGLAGQARVRFEESDRAALADRKAAHPRVARHVEHAARLIQRHAVGRFGEPPKAPRSIVVVHAACARATGQRRTSTAHPRSIRQERSSARDAAPDAALRRPATWRGCPVDHGKAWGGDDGVCTR